MQVDFKFNIRDNVVIHGDGPTGTVIALRLDSMNTKTHPALDGSALQTWDEVKLALVRYLDSSCNPRREWILEEDLTLKHPDKKTERPEPPADLPTGGTPSPHGLQERTTIAIEQEKSGPSSIAMRAAEKIRHLILAIVNTEFRPDTDVPLIVSIIDKYTHIDELLEVCDSMSKFCICGASVHQDDQCLTCRVTTVIAKIKGEKPRR